MGQARLCELRPWPTTSPRSRFFWVSKVREEWGGAAQKVGRGSEEVERLAAKEELDVTEFQGGVVVAFAVFPGTEEEEEA